MILMSDDIINELLNIIKEAQYELWCELKSTYTEEQFNNEYDFVSQANELIKKNQLTPK